MSLAADYLAELTGRREEIEANQERLAHEFRKREIKPPGMFRNSSFLYMQSFPGDTGERPFSGVPFWRSPDVTIEPLAHPDQTTTELAAGETYRVRVRLRNRGDLAVPAAKVELFLVNPTLGFTASAATNLTLGKVPSAWVPSGGNAVAEFTWMVPSALSGHRCLFARAFSFSPLELPVDLDALSPPADRHVAQLNLNIVAQAQRHQFNLVHAAEARILITLRPLPAEELLQIAHPALAGVRPARAPQSGWGELAPIELVDAKGLDIASTDEGVRIVAGGRGDGLRSSRLVMTVPDLGLQPGEAVGLDVTSLDEDTGELTGGITLVIVGRARP